MMGHSVRITDIISRAARLWQPERYATVLNVALLSRQSCCLAAHSHMQDQHGTMDHDHWGPIGVPGRQMSYHW